jgi:hypothetical protein
LLPTRGALGPGFGPGAPGLGPAGADSVSAADGACCAGAGVAAAGAADSTGAAGAAGAGAAGAGVVGAGTGAAGVSGFTAAGAAGVGRAAGLGPGRGPPGLAPVLGLGALAVVLPFSDGESDFSDGNDSRRRRATGASTVDEADLTNSPCSLSRASSSLLVTPSSFANSCTRALPATALLTERPSEAWCPHDLGLSPMDVHRWCFTVCSSVLPCASTGESVLDIRDDDAIGRLRFTVRTTDHDTQQVGGRSFLLAPDTSSHR